MHSRLGRLIIAGSIGLLAVAAAPTAAHAEPDFQSYIQATHASVVGSIDFVATPGVNLTDGQTVTVSAGDFPPNAPVVVLQCQTSPIRCDAANYKVLKADANGDWTTTFRPHDVFTGTDVNGATAAVSCRATLCALTAGSLDADPQVIGYQPISMATLNPLLQAKCAATVSQRKSLVATADAQYAKAKTDSLRTSIVNSLRASIAANDKALLANHCDPEPTPALLQTA